MQNRRVPPLLVIVVLFSGLTVTVPAYAYVDPNAGGLLFQLLTPLLALTAAGLTFARRQLARAWVMLTGAVKSGYGRIFRGQEVE